ncbi:MAG TPA: glycerol-3-phosphate dehydrogenase/oxidase [Kofleriaceae bacterium]|jgi:glycerol-3-phosphate dehydrogenase|nr:glycerol-3-phosphate dehydrogenase/oxidase [Kofleriaceae bacterium]
MWDRDSREATWKQLSEPWDLVVVGGGITGAGVLHQAVQQGLRVLLVEAKDFAYGTSSRSTKLVHGGLRYLRQAQFKVTHESLRERERLMREAPGLVNDLGFSLASFPGDSVSPWKYGLGLAIYDVLAGKWQHQKLTRHEMIALHPELEGSDVRSGYLYHDARTDDARLVVRVLREATRAGGVALNYARVEDLVRDGEGTVVGVRIRDEAPGPDHGRVAEVMCKVTVNATGVWADELRAQAGAAPRMRKIRGSHITFRYDRLPVPGALSLLHPSDGRSVFVVPWEGVTIFGTTDKDHAPALSEEPRITDEEVDYLLACVQRAFPARELTHSDVIGSWAGVRPVINTGKADPSKESREHAIWQEHGLLTVAGGKLTTFALMARDTLKAVAPVLGKPGPRARVFEEPHVPSWPAALDDGMRLRLLGRYGQDAAPLTAPAAEDPSLLEPIGDSLATWAELVHAARHEAIIHLEDLLLRRVRLGFLLPRGGLDQIDRIRALAQPALGWDDARWASEQAAYAQLWSHAYSGR